VLYMYRPQQTIVACARMFCQVCTLASWQQRQCDAVVVNSPSMVVFLSARLVVVLGVTTACCAGARGKCWLEPPVQQQVVQRHRHSGCIKGIDLVFMAPSAKQS
jgi:hypothetical protein